MKNTQLYITAFLIALIAASCTKVIDLKLNDDSGKLVIEGNITDTSATQQVQLSENVPFTNTNSYPAVTGATVSVSDNNGNTYPFTEGPQGIYTTKKLTTITGTKYTMSVLVKGITYNASSTIPPLVPIDSITFKKDEFNKSGSLRQITIHFQDPAGVPNQYRIALFINSKQVKNIFAFNDDFTDGRYVDLDLIQNDIDIHPGDTARIEMQCIDKPIYTYWFTLMQQNPQGPGGGVTPSNPPTNITPMALGYFSAHTTQVESIIVR